MLRTRQSPANGTIQKRKVVFRIAWMLVAISGTFYGADTARLDRVDITRGIHYARSDGWVV